MMKRMLCLLLAVCMLLPLAACDREVQKPKDDDTIDVEYFVKLGKIPECDYALGADIDALIAAFSPEETDESEPEEAGGHDHDEEEIFNISEQKDRVRISTGAFDYYYRPGRKDDGVACIVTFETAYGFTANSTIVVEIEELLKDFTAGENTADLFFLPASGSFTSLTYTFGDNAVVFVFENNALCATVLYRPALWEQ